MTTLEVLTKNLQPWAYDYSGGNSVYVDHVNMVFIRKKLNESGLSYVKVYPKNINSVKK